MSQAGPTEPELPELEELEELEVPLEPPEDELVPVSGFAESGVPASTGAGAGVESCLGGSFALVSSGFGSADFVSCVASPSPSSGDVAHAEMRARSDNAATGMRAKRRMTGTLAAEVCRVLGRLSTETLR